MIISNSSDLIDLMGQRSHSKVDFVSRIKIDVDGSERGNRQIMANCDPECYNYRGKPFLEFGWAEESFKKVGVKSPQRQHSPGNRILTLSLSRYLLL